MKYLFCAVGIALIISSCGNSPEPLPEKSEKLVFFSRLLIDPYEGIAKLELGTSDIIQELRDARNLTNKGCSRITIHFEESEGDEQLFNRNNQPSSSGVKRKVKL